MGDLPMILFGSFTEEETLKLLKQLAHNVNVNKVKRDHKSSSSRCDTGLQFGSLDFASLGATTGTLIFNDKGTVASYKGKGGCENAKRRTRRDKLKGGHEPQLSDCTNTFANGWISNSDLEISKVDMNSGSMHISEKSSASTSEIAASPRVIDADDEGDGSGVAIPVFDSSTCEEEEVHKLEFMPEFMPPVSGKSLLPRGLINTGNLCFLNATLQALLCCSPFVWLLQDLKSRSIPKIGYTVLQAFIEFISEFDTPKDSTSINIEKQVLESGSPFTPAMFEPVLKQFTPEGLSGRPRQEDAQEFLSFVLDQMHAELLKLEGQSSLNGGIRCFNWPAEDDDWETVGPKNKSAITRTQFFVPSALSAIFGGQLRSVVKARGNKASATIQPYRLLHLDIFPENIHTIEDALHLSSIPEAIEGYKASSGKAGLVSASKSIKIEALSKILILHLKRFSYGSKGSTKLPKPVRFPLELIIGRDLLVSPNSECWTYELVSTITHHGRDLFKGHYTADARYPDGRWLRFDDSSVTVLSTNQVLHDQAYVLFYRQV